MSRLPREARDGIMRAWLEILRERHPEVSWIPATNRGTNQDEPQSPSAFEEIREPLAA
jgi:hypothetical protein